jgi:hypothetical protein
MNIYAPILQERFDGSHFEIEQLLDKCGKLSITLVAKSGRKLVLEFDAYVAYRKLDEGDAMLTLSAMQKSGSTTKVLYRVDDSEFLHWFNKERCGPMSANSPVHYTVAGINDIVDVLSLEPPAVLTGDR